jgi:hypothetical protein
MKRGATVSERSTEEKVGWTAEQQARADEILAAERAEQARLREQHTRPYKEKAKERAAKVNERAERARSAKVREDFAAAAETKSASEEDAASVPFMLTRAMKDGLRARGYSDEQIRNMTPEEAHDILAGSNKQRAEADAKRKADEELKGLGLDKPPQEVSEKEKRSEQDTADEKLKAVPYSLGWMNKRHAVIFDYGGKCVVADTYGEEVHVVAFEDFKKRYQNRIAREGRRVLTVGDWWLAHDGREEYQGLVLRPDTLEREIVDGGLRYLNLWRGFAVRPRQANWPRMRDHIYEVLAAGDTAGGDYIMNWSAYGVQWPAERAEQSLCFRGEEGIGKGTFANTYLELFGVHGFRVHSARELTGDFNAHFRNKVMILADEARECPGRC